MPPNPDHRRIDVRPGAICWTRTRPFEPAKLMLVVARQVSNVAVLELPVAASQGNADVGLEAALALVQIEQLAVSGLSLLGPAVGQLEPQQLENLRQALTHRFVASVV